MRGVISTKEITFERSLRGFKLRTPITITIAEPQGALEEKLLEYILNTFIPRQPTLAKFALENESTKELAKHLLLHRTGSEGSLYSSIFIVRQFGQFLNTRLDQIIASCIQEDYQLRQQSLKQVLSSIDEFIFAQQQQGISPCTISQRVKYIKSFFCSNGIKLNVSYSCARAFYQDRAPTAEELRTVLNIAKLRERVLITMLALGGFRIGTLLALQYRHVRYELEKGIVPLHVHIESEINKGKYCSYDTFLNEEAVEYLKAYFNARKRGTAGVPPETLSDNSPIIKNYSRNKEGEIQTITPSDVNNIVRGLYLAAGVGSLLPSCKGSKIRRRYDVRIHSLRKFFRTELASRRVERDYIEYMMGHRLSTYHDVKMKGIEFLRGVYLTSGIRIQPKLNLTKLEALKEIISAWGLNPDEILTRQALGGNSNPANCGVLSSKLDSS